LQAPIEVVLTPGTSPARAATLRHAVTSRFLPSAVVVPLSDAHAAALAAVAPWTGVYARGGDEPAAFMCREFVCAAPVSTPEALAILLDEATHPGPIEEPGTIQ
jgi:uncharacterized protein YyaL (SSP411 family)